MTYDTRSSSPPETTSDGRVADFFGLRGDAWMRHANPRSVWTRFTCVTLIVIAVWSRTWIGWYCVIPIALASVWTWINPRLFGVPASTRNWASKAVFGERIWLRRKLTPIPEQFSSLVPNLANAYSAIGLAMLAYGVVVYDIWLTIAGIVIVHGGKLWYLDRMVLLFEDVKHRDATVAAWEYGR
ncbi:MAG: DUF6653 family protein [Ilumatobacteraceae bacterium]